MGDNNRRTETDVDAGPGILGFFVCRAQLHSLPVHRSI
jgi:hypothetical protein